MAFVKVDETEPIEKAIKRFKRMVEKEGENMGKFSWYIDKVNGMSDPDGYLEMSPEEILSDLFK